jgi:hypothetical protein
LLRAAKYGSGFRTARSGRYPALVRLAVGDVVVYASHGGHMAARERRVVLGKRQEVVVLALAGGALGGAAGGARARAAAASGQRGGHARVQQTLGAVPVVSGDPWLKRRRDSQAKLTGGGPSSSQSSSVTVGAASRRCPRKAQVAALSGRTERSFERRLRKASTCSSRPAQIRDTSDLEIRSPSDSTSWSILRVETPATYASCTTETSSPSVSAAARCSSLAPGSCGFRCCAAAGTCNASPTTSLHTEHSAADGARSWPAFIYSRAGRAALSAAPRC